MHTVPYVAGPFSSRHVLLTWGGKLPGEETWSCSLRIAEQSSVGIGATVPPQAEVKSWLDGSLKTAVVDYHTRASTKINPAAKLSFVKANRIDLDGTYMDASTNEYLVADIAGGGPAYAPSPNQLTIAVSLTTGYSRGPAHRGRFYLPTPSVSFVASTATIDPGDVAGIRDSTKTFLEAIADVPGFDSPVSLTPVVMSRKSGAATYRVITGVEVGHVMDTQRRRRKSIPENYVGVALDLGAS